MMNAESAKCKTWDDQLWAKQTLAIARRYFAPLEGVLATMFGFITIVICLTLAPDISSWSLAQRTLAHVNKYAPSWIGERFYR